MNEVGALVGQYNVSFVNAWEKDDFEIVVYSAPLLT